MESTGKAAIVLLILSGALCVAPGTAFGGECCGGTNPPPDNVRPSNVSFSDGSGNALTGNTDGHPEQQLTVPCEFDVTLSATDSDGTVVKYLNTGGSLPSQVSLKNGNTLSGTIDNNCDASGSPWGTTWKAQDDDGAKSISDSTLILNCQERSNSAPTKPAIVEGSTSGKSCTFRIRVESTDPDGSIKEYQLGSCDLPGHTFDKKNGVLKTSVTVAAVDDSKVALTKYTCKIRAKDNDCRYSEWLTLDFSCDGGMTQVDPPE
jgi:hypothetical protein